MGLCKRIAASWCAAFFLIVPGHTGADVPAGVQYQGVLQDGFGAPLNATVTIDLGIWNAAAAGVLLYSETHTGVQVVEGVFEVEIGTGTSGGTYDESLFSDAGRWLEVAVDGGTLSPRQKFLSVPFALQAGQVSGLTGNICPLGEVVTGFDSFGVPVCGAIEKTGVTLDPSGGSGVSIAIGADGFPLVAYWGSNGFTLIHCTNAPCSTADAAVNVSAVTSTDYSLAIGADGFPVVAYWEFATGPAKLIHCTDVSCNTFDTPVSLPSGGEGPFGEHPAISIGADGFPSIAYSEVLAVMPPPPPPIPSVLPFVFVVHCTNAACTTLQSSSGLSTLRVGGGASIALAVGTDGFPVLTYSSVPDVFLVQHCTTTFCSSEDNATIIDPTNGDILVVSIAISVGIPTILFQEPVTILPPWPYKLARCADSSCLSLSGPVVDLPLPASVSASIAPIGSGSMICSLDQVLHCTNPSCTAQDPLVTLPKSGDSCSIAIGGDGFPVIALGNPSEISVVHCVDAGCVE